MRSGFSGKDHAQLKSQRAIPGRRRAPRRGQTTSTPHKHRSNHMVSQKQVCVIGAGVSGLAAAKAFAARGHKVTIVEKSTNVGGVWDPSRAYPDVQTQSPKDLYRYTDKAMPDAYPEWPKGPQVHAYLVDYAKGHGLDHMLRLNTEVSGMSRRADGKPGWTLGLTGPGGV